MKLSYLIIAFSFFLVSCSSENSDSNTKTIEPDNQITSDLRSDIESVHRKDLFLKEEYVQFDLNLKFGGKERLNGTITLATNSSKGVIETKSGEKIYFNQDKVYIPSEKENSNKARFDAYTWSYFFLLPYKLSDGGTYWNNYSSDSLNGKEYETNKLTFGDGIGDAPEDWYIVYSDRGSHIINVAAYIVTAGKSVEEAEKDPHAIQYLNYEMVDGIPFAHQWKFWGWNETEGLTNVLGEADLSNINFPKLNDSYFTPPSEFVAI